MRKNLTELVFILDKSGSMSGMGADVVGGFNSMIERQRKEEGEAIVSTVLFSQGTTVLHDRVNLKDIKPLTLSDYEPGGMTALLDAIGEAIHHIGNVHKYARDEDVPEQTVFVITTDGEENSSVKYSSKRIKNMIRRQEEKYGWKFLFLADNIDAVETGERMGIRKENAVSYCVELDTEELFETVSDAISYCRVKKSISDDWAERLLERKKEREKQ